MFHIRIFAAVAVLSLCQPTLAAPEPGDTDAHARAKKLYFSKPEASAGGDTAALHKWQAEVLPEARSWFLVGCGQNDADSCFRLVSEPDLKEGLTAKEVASFAVKANNLYRDYCKSKGENCWYWDEYLTTLEEEIIPNEPLLANFDIKSNRVSLTISYVAECLKLEKKHMETSSYLRTSEVCDDALGMAEEHVPELLPKLEKHMVSIGL